MDLFSGDEERMKFALNCLIDNPQNNFRLFIDKEQVQLKHQIKEVLSEDTNLNRQKLIDLLVFVLNYSFDGLDDEIKSNQLNQTCKYHYDIHKLSTGKTNCQL